MVAKTTQNADEVMQEINLYELIAHYIKYWAVIVGLTLFGIVCGLIYNNYIQVPLYKSNATLLIINADKTVTQNDSTLINNYLELFKSRRVIDTVIEKLNLDDSYSEIAQQISASNSKDTQVIKTSASTIKATTSKNILNKTIDSFKNEVKELYNKENIRVVDGASMPEKPYNVNQLLQLGLAAAAGFILSIIILFFVYDFKTSIKAKPTKKSAPKSKKKVAKNRSKKLAAKLTIIKNNVKLSNAKKAELRKQAKLEKQDAREIVRQQNEKKHQIAMQENAQSQKVLQGEKTERLRIMQQEKTARLKLSQEDKAQKAEKRRLIKLEISSGKQKQKLARQEQYKKDKAEKAKTNKLNVANKAKRIKARKTANKIKINKFKTDLSKKANNFFNAIKKSSKTIADKRANVKAEKQKLAEQAKAKLEAEQKEFKPVHGKGVAINDKMPASKTWNNDKTSNKIKLKKLIKKRG